MTRKSATGRADLLRALALGVESPLALEDSDGGWFGFRIKPEQPSRRSRPELTSQWVPPPPEGQKEPPAAEVDRRQPLQMETIWAVVERDSFRDPPEGEAAAPAAAEVRPITEEQARGGERVARYEDLVPWARLTPVLQRRLAQPRAGGIDLKRLCRQVADQRPPRHLPRQLLRRWHPDIVVALDFSDRLWPYRWDMHRLCEQLRRHCGRTGLSLRLLENGPRGGWSPWLNDAEADAMGLPEVQDWVHPPAGSRLLVVGDLGALSPEASVRAQWLSWIQEVQAAGVEVEALMPIGADQLPPEFGVRIPLIRWSPDSHFRPERPAPDEAGNAAAAGPAALNEALKDLLTLVSSLRRVDPPLLRALRRALPRQHGNAGLEGAVWSHPDVEAGMACALRPAAAPRWQQHLSGLDLALQQELQTLRRQHHQHLRAALRHEEVLLAETHSAAGTVNGAELGEATAFMEQLAHWVVSQSTEAVPDGWQGFAEDVVRRVDGQTARRFGKVFTRLLAVDIRARRGHAHQGDELPPWVDVAELASFLAPNGQDKRDHWIVEDVRSRQILLQSRPPTIGQRALGAHFEADRLVVTHVQTGRAVVHTTRAGSVVLCDSASAETLELRANALRLQLAPVRRPFGIEGWDLRFGQQGSVPRVRIPHLRKGEVELPDQWLYSPPSEVDPDRRYHLIQGPFEDLRDGPPGEVGYSIDEFGVYVDLAIQGVTQRLLYLPPGRFLMGSPADEPDRHDNEGPQHEVTLTRGFWLADTCCTQALWQAVMGGKNPSHFKGDPNLPVDSVSWDDVQTFLGRLQRQLPKGVEAVLPIEAQWEYACRAGTTTRFSFGDELSPERANFGGNVGRTAPVKSLPANPWGLYEMHGNLWEWCADAPRKYGAEPVEDPDGGQDGVLRVLRGGSWSIGARWARSASRDVPHRDLRNLHFGFRIALRSIEPGAEGGILGWTEPARVWPQVESGAGVGPAEPGPLAEGIWSRMSGLFKGRK